VRKVLQEPADGAPRCPVCDGRLVYREVPGPERTLFVGSAAWRCALCRTWYEDDAPEAPSKAVQGSLLDDARAQKPGPGGPSGASGEHP
jgi:hypothetical protein